VASKKENRQSKKAYSPADSLKAGKNTKVRKEFADYDYLKILDPEQLEFLGKFNNEFYGAGISKTKSGKVRAKHLHQKLSDVKEIYDDNNRRNNDVLGVTKANALLSDIETSLNNNDGWYIFNNENTEDAQIAAIDSDEAEILTYEEYQDVKHNLTMEMQFYYESIYGDRND
jgi:hypothetical protein